jgi:hypothetical protein
MNKSVTLLFLSDYHKNRNLPKEVIQMSITKAPASAILMVLLPALLFALPCPAQETEQGPGAPPPEGSSLHVTATICTAVEDREPVGAGETFPATVEKLYCHTLVEGAEEPTAVTHVWYRGDEILAEVILSVNSPHWRTWSSKRIIESWTGAWRVEILDEAGELITSLAFNIQ